MNIKKLFNSSRKKKTYDGYTVENVMEYLRQEGLCPETDANDAKVVRFKYQRKSMNHLDSTRDVQIFGHIASAHTAELQHENGSQAFASCHKRILHSLIDNPLERIFILCKLKELLLNFFTIGFQNKFILSGHFL